MNPKRAQKRPKETVSVREAGSHRGWPPREERQGHPTALPPTCWLDQTPSEPCEGRALTRCCLDGAVDSHRARAWESRAWDGFRGDEGHQNLGDLPNTELRR